jgi:hypothetical protein
MSDKNLSNSDLVTINYSESKKRYSDESEISPKDGKF